MSRSPAAVATAVPALAVVLSLLVLAPAPILGQGDDMARAREAFSRGQALFDEGDFDGALAAFTESLGAFPHFRTIFNIALCHEKLGDVEAAVAMYRRYVEWPSEVPNREEVRVKMTELQGTLPPPPETAPAPPAPAPPSVDPPEAGSPEAAPPEAEPGPDLRLPGWIAVGAGAAGVIAGGVLLGLAGRRVSEIEGIEGVPYDPEEHDALQREGRAFEVSGWVAMGAGAAIAASGAVLLLVSAPAVEGDREEGASAAAFLGPAAGGVTIGLEGRF